jgi:hypothetical protein
MALVTGPLHSDSASGTLDGSLTYSKWKGRQYVRTCVTPTNPRSAKQRGVRGMFAFLAAAWKAIGGTAQATWATLAAADTVSNFNAYMKANMKSWVAGTGVSEATPAAKSSSANTVASKTATGGTRAITGTVTPTAATAAWGIAIFAGTSTGTLSWTDCVAVVPVNGTSAVAFNITGLTAGTYQLTAAVVNTDGVVGTLATALTGIAVTG